MSIDQQAMPRRPRIDEVPLHRPLDPVRRRVVGSALTWLGVPMVHGTETSVGPTLRVLDRNAFSARLLRDGATGLGDSYIAGEWDTADLPGLLTPLAGKLRALTSAPAFRAGVRLAARFKTSRTVNPDQAARNAAWHYDLPASFFERILDESLTYSAAWFRSPTDSLEQAQAGKRSRIIDQLNLPSSAQVLEIGGGWGALAVDLAHRGHSVTSLNPSAQQVRTARERAAGSHGRSIQFLVQDYRTATGRYDGAVSVEMIEAVGQADLAAYFDQVQARLTSGGRFVVQFIHTGHERMLWAGGRATWIGKHIFPGGQILSQQAVQTAARKAGFVLVDSLELGADYARTIRHWDANLRAHRQVLHQEGFGHEFLRMWEYYHAICIAGFESEDIGCSQWTLRRQ